MAAGDREIFSLMGGVGGGYSRQNTPFILLAVVGTLLAVVMALWMRERQQNRQRRLAESRKEWVESGSDQKLQRFSLTGFDDKGQKFWNLEGQTAKIDPGQTVFLDKNVTLRLQDSTVIRTDRVQWSPDGGTLTTDAAVTVEHQNATIHGRGAVGRPKDSFVQLNRDIEMTIEPNTRLSCKGPMKIFYKDNKMTFYRSVKVVDDKGTLTSSRMDVLFGPEDKKVSQIVAEGNVIIERGGDTTRSQRAIYTVATGSIRLEGNPEITLHKDAAKLLDAPIRS